jgi:uncharacterized protein (TIGR00299 family) protein
MRLWEARQVPVYHNGIEKELVTPTGAAIAVTLAKEFGAPPAMSLHRIGLGAGSQDFAIPNILRLWVGQASKESESLENPERILETICVLETQIDDLNPQAIGYLFEVLFQVGAVDVFTQAIGMKKSRPGILLTVICPPDKVLACEAVIFRETTTLGIRHLSQQRSILEREIQKVETVFGTVRVKIAAQGSGTQKTIINVQPEYEDCAQLARKCDRPWRIIYQAALTAWNSQQPVER